MLMVILGAGASFDSVDTTLQPHMAGESSIRPPLASQLFEARPAFGKAIQDFPEILPVVSRLRRAVQQGQLLETELEKLRTEAGDSPQRNAQVLAVSCYLRQIIAETAYAWSRAAFGVTCFHELVDEIESWRLTQHEPVVYVSFNYDLSLIHI